MVKPKRDERFAIRFSRDERKALEALALKEDATLTQLVRRGLREVLRQGSASRPR